MLSASLIVSTVMSLLERLFSTYAVAASTRRWSRLTICISLIFGSMSAALSSCFDCVKSVSLTVDISDSTLPNISCCCS